MERTFRLTFFDHEGSRVVLERTFNDTETVSAALRAYAWAYVKADMSPFAIRETTNGDE